ncbi:MAG: response regulator [bacterium]|nr:response regulator [bacterium]
MCLLFIALTASGCAAGSTLKVAFYELDGFFERGADDARSGYGVELLEKISEYTGIHFEYVQADTWEQTKSLLLSGKVDARLPVTLPSSRQSHLEYTEESVMNTYRALMTLKSRGDLYYKDYAHFSTLKVAISKSFYITTGLRVYLDDIGITDKNLVFFDEYLDCRRALDAGKVDALISNIMDMTHDMKVLARFNSVSNYISMKTGDERINIINAALNEIKMDDPSFLSLLYQKYYPARTLTPFTREEAEFVRSAGVIKVGQLTGRDTFACRDGETGRTSGIFVDLCDLIAQKSGLKFTYDFLPVGMRAVDWLDKTDGKLVAGVMFSRASRPSSKLARSDAAFKTSLVVIGRRGSAFDPEKVRSIAVPAGYISGKTRLPSLYPQAKINYYDTNEECLNAIVSGEADFMLQNIYAARNALQSPRFDSLQIFPVCQIDEEMRFVTGGGENTQLLSVLNKTIASITYDELNDIIIANTIARTYKITWRDTYDKFHTPIRLIIALLLTTVILFGLIVTIRHRNIRQIEEKNRQLVEAYKQARLASRAKSDFLARMSHEIRTPMNAIIGITTLAMDHTDSPEEVREDLRKVALSSRVLLSIVNDILDMSAIESGKLKIAHAPFDLKQLISSLTTVYYAQCKAKGVSFQTKLNGSIDEWLTGDQLRVNQVLMNLLSNAVKFTDHGEVLLSVAQRTVGEGKIFLHFTVTDSGCGIDKEMLSRLWSPFEQESANTAREHGGSGLGLSIVKNLVTMMGGAIGVESEKGKGTTFSVNLPFDRCGGGKVSTGEVMKNLRVLIVDDAKDARDYAAAVFERIGTRHASASTGEEALAMMARAAAENDPYNVCIVDWKMPEMDGIEVTRRIRAQYNRDAVVIIASAYDHSEADGIADAAGADRFVTKPLFQSTLFDLLMSLSGGRLMKGGSAAGFDFTGRRVLMAEDNDMNRLVGAGLLKKANIACETAVNGKEALEMFAAAAPGYYDAILMDIQMPVMNGYEATKAIRLLWERPDAKTIPILALTADAFTEDVAAALQCGMDDHITKPIELDILISALEKAFTRKEGRKENFMNKSKILLQYGIDYAGGLARFLDDQELYDSVLEAFLTDTLLAKARRAFEDGDRATLFSCVHELKGSSGNANMTALYEASCELVSLLRDNAGSDEEIAESFARFTDAYLLARDGIRKALEV